MDGWLGVKAILMIAYSNIKLQNKLSKQAKKKKEKGNFNVSLPALDMTNCDCLHLKLPNRFKPTFGE